MVRIAQLGIAFGALGAMLTLMGLFPGVTGLEPTIGFGVVQIFAILLGYLLLILGALIYVKFTFYPGKTSNLIQQIGTRLSMTGLVLAAMSALADVLGFGSHGSADNSTIFLGRLQAIAIIASFLIASIGVMVYAVGGKPSARNGDQP